MIKMISQAHTVSSLPIDPKNLLKTIALIPNVTLRQDITNINKIQKSN